MYVEVIKTVVKHGQAEAARRTLDKWIAAARKSPGHLWASYFSPEDVSNEARESFGIEDPERTFFVTMAWETDQAVAEFYRKFQSGTVSLLPGQEVYVSGHFTG
jgi:quinol monooxygenase YgiN